jgi:hypothetical protein
VKGRLKALALKATGPRLFIELFPYEEIETP